MLGQTRVDQEKRREQSAQACELGELMGTTTAEIRAGSSLPLLRARWPVAMKRAAREVDDALARSKKTASAADNIAFESSKRRFLDLFEKLTPEKIRLHCYSAIRANLKEHWGDTEWKEHWDKFGPRAQSEE